MIARDFLSIVYKWVDQRMASKLIWDSTMLAYMNFALSDIYSYQWKHWTFMFWKQELAIDETMVLDQLEFTLDHPMMRLYHIEDLTGDHGEFTLTNLDYELEWGQIFFRPHQNTLKIKNNNTWYILHYIHSFATVTLEDEVPLPDIFLWPLYNRMLTYIYPEYWQYWDWKDSNSSQKYNEQMQHFSMMDSLQITWVISNIH